MKVTLSRPASWVDYLDAGEVDETVDVSDELGQRLLGDGYARRPETSLRSLSSADLDTRAAELAVDLTGATSKADKVARLEAATAGNEA